MSRKIHKTSKIQFLGTQTTQAPLISRSIRFLAIQLSKYLSTLQLKNLSESLGQNLLDSFVLVLGQLSFKNLWLSKLLWIFDKLTNRKRIEFSQYSFTTLKLFKIHGKYNQWSISFLTRRLQISTSKRDLNSLATIFSEDENLFLYEIDNPWAKWLNFCMHQYLATLEKPKQNDSNILIFFTWLAVI